MARTIKLTFKVHKIIFFNAYRGRKNTFLLTLPPTLANIHVRVLNPEKTSNRALMNFLCHLSKGEKMKTKKHGKTLHRSTILFIYITLKIQFQMLECTSYVLLHVTWKSHLLLHIRLVFYIHHEVNELYAYNFILHYTVQLHLRKTSSKTACYQKRKTLPMCSSKRSVRNL